VHPGLTRLEAGRTKSLPAFSLLPGGARRLDVVTDGSIRIPYDKLRTFMGLDLPVVDEEVPGETSTEVQPLVELH